MFKKLFAKHFIFSAVALVLAIAWACIVPMFVTIQTWNILFWVAPVLTLVSIIGYIPTFIFLVKDIKANK